MLKRERIWKVLLCGMILVLAIGLMAGCGDKTPATDAAATDTPTTTNSAFEQTQADLMKALAPLPDKATGVKLAAIESTLANPFWVTMKEGYEAAAKEYGVTIDVMATETETDTNGQLEMFNTLLQKDYAGIAISPITEQNLIPGIVSANGKGVKVVAVGNGVDTAALTAAKGKIEAFITTDFKKQGTLGADYILEKIGNKGKVAIIEGQPGGTQSEARKTGAEEAFKAAGSSITVLPVKTGNWDRQTAYDLTTAWIDANPDLKAIICGNDVMALGAVEALKAKGVKDKVVVVGVDFTDDARASIKAGELDASVAMSPYLFGEAGLITALKAIQGQTIGDDIIWTPTILVNADNVDSMEGWK